MLIDEIFNQMSLGNMTSIDDIESLQVDGSTLRGLMIEYKQLFDEVADIETLEDYLGLKIEVSEENVIGGFKIERSF